jgi:hypothetical protein
VETGKPALDVEVFRIDGSRELNPKNSWASPTPFSMATASTCTSAADGTAALTNDGRSLWTTRLRYESQHGNGGSPALYR